MHGDELTPLATVHEVFEKLDPSTLSGSVIADTGGFVEYLVDLNDAVEEGQPLAVQRNAFGEVIGSTTATTMTSRGATSSTVRSGPSSISTSSAAG
jgi:predicted deacylase